MSSSIGRSVRPTVSQLPDSEPPLRIAIVHTADIGGGAEACTTQLHQSLIELGHQSQMFVGTKRGDDPNIHEIPRTRPFPGMLRAVKLVEQQTGWQYLYQPGFRRLNQLLGDVDVVHYNSLWYGRHGYADLAALPGLTREYPSLMTLHDWWMLTGHCAHPTLDCERWKIGCGQCPDLTLPPAIPRDGTRFNWKRKQKAIGKSDVRVVAVSDWLAEEVRQCPIFSGKEIHTVHNGIDQRVFFPRNRQEMRARWGLPAAAFIVMIAGQSVEGDRPQGNGARNLALQALAHSGCDPFLLAVGKSSSQVIGQWSGPGRAIGYQTELNNLAELYCAADVVLAASLWETFGRVPAEAQMCGVPVAAFGTGGIPEIVQHEVTGLITPRLDGEALGASVRFMFESPQRREQMGVAAASRAIQRFSTLMIARQYVAHYRAEMAKRGQSRIPEL